VKLGREDGYTLVESLVAFTILAIVVIAALSAISTSYRSIQRAREVTAAVSLAEQLIQDASSRPKLQPGQSTGTKGGFTWSIIVNEIANARWQKQQLFVLEVDVQSSQGKSIRPAHMSTTVMRTLP
jgi:general secretion pathway protein I